MIISSQELDLTKIKLIIWDLDNTFWEGIITEEEILPVQDNMHLVRSLSEHGVVNSICSKNYYDECKEKLEALGMWEFFVFPSIDWTPKSQRVLQIVQDMGLRPVNVLFLDDEPANLQRVLSVDNSIMCGTAQELVPSLLSQVSSLKEDPTCKRLKQYHEMENRFQAKSQYATDEDFLSASEIKVRLGRDVLNQLDRIYDMINRTNQLNFTKKRLTKEETELLLNDPSYECAYISCTDKYCDYGIIGFLALNKAANKLEHYLFSCRTIGMGIEQFIYACYDFPELIVSGEVITELNKTDRPKWITLVDSFDTDSENLTASDKILIKGPCDVSQITPYFSNENLFEEEFAYISSEKTGLYIESFNHTSQILAALDLPEEKKEHLAQTIPFIDHQYYDTTIFSVKHDVIIFSLLTDYSLGLYRSKRDPEIILPFGQFSVDYTKPENWTVAKRILLGDNCPQDKLDEQFEIFSEEFEPIGVISKDNLIANLQRILDNISKDTLIVFLNGAEFPYPGTCKPAYEGRHLLHIEYNEAIRSFVKSRKNCCIIKVTDYLSEPEPYLDTINHYKKETYYRIAKAVQEQISDYDSTRNLTVKTEKELARQSARQKIRHYLSKIYHRIRG